MTFSALLKYSWEATGCPEKSNTTGWGFQTSNRNVLPCSSIYDVESEGEEAALPEKVALNGMNFGHWQIFDCVQWSYFYSFEIFFLGFLSWNF